MTENLQIAKLFISKEDVADIISVPTESFYIANSKTDDKGNTELTLLLDSSVSSNENFEFCSQFPDGIGHIRRQHLLKNK